MRLIAIAFVLALAAISIPADLAGDIAPVQEATAAPCVWGWEDECVIEARECFQPRRLYCE